MNDDTRRAAWRWFAYVALVATGGVVLWRVAPVTDWIRLALERVEALGPWAPIAWFLCFTALATLSFPTTPLYLASGVLFGFGLGSLVGLPAGYAAAIASFLVARHLARDTWEERLLALPRFRELVDPLEEESFRLVLLTRLSPFLPASVKNYGLGLTRVRLRHFAAATALGQAPVAAVHVYLGVAGGAALLGSEGETSRLHVGLLVAGGVASLLLLVLVGRRVNRVLANAG